MFNFLSMMDDRESRIVGNDDVAGGTVDTCRVTDSTKSFETAIEHPFYRDGKWIVVELYDTEEQAKEGHQKWIEILKNNPSKLVDVNECEIEDFAQALGHTTRGEFVRNESVTSNQ